MNSAIYALSGLVLGAAIYAFYRRYVDHKAIYVKYDSAKLADIQRRSDEIIAEIKLRNPDIRDKADALKEINRYRNSN